MQSISEKMQQRQTEARTKITAELWAEKPDEHKIADVALKAGLAPTEIDTLEAKIATAKATLAELSATDLPALKLASERAAAAAQKSSAQLEKAQAAFDTAEATAADAHGAFEAAFQRFRAAAGGARSGALPADRLPGIVTRIMDFDSAVDHAQRFHSEAAQDRIEKRRLEGLVSTLTEAAKSAGAFKRDNVSVMTLAGNDAGPTVAKRLKDARRDLLAVIKKIEGHAGEQQRRDKAVTAAKAAIWG